MRTMGLAVVVALAGGCTLGLSALPKEESSDPEVPLVDDPGATDPGTDPGDPSQPEPPAFDTGIGADPSDTGSTGPTSTANIVPELVVILADFGIDPASREAVAVDFGQGAFPPSVFFLVANDLWTGSYADVDNYCVVGMNAPGAVSLAPWASSTPGVIFGWDVPANALVGGDCVGRVDPVLWPDPVGDFSGLDWGVGLSAAVEPTYAAFLLANGYPQSELDNNLGHGLTGTLADAYSATGYLDGGLARSFATNSSYVVQSDAQGNWTQRTPGQMLSGGMPTAGYYTTEFVLLFSDVWPVF